MKTLLLALLSLAALPTYAGTISGQIQGPSGLPIRNATMNYVLNQAGLIVGTGAVVPTAASCYTDASGNVVGLPNMLVAPTAAANYGSGSLPGGIYFIVTTWINAAGNESAPSPELRIQLTSTGSLQIALPTSIPASATGIHVYAATTSGAEQAQGIQALTGPFIFSALNSGVNPPASNNSVCSIAFNDTIIPYTGYTVSLISATGNAYPGYPQSWQLNGGLTGTVNISQGAPLWNGVVIYPAPILSQPLNHGPQSISGPLDFGGYNVTNVGTLTACTVNGMVNAMCSAFTGDIGSRVNQALATCAQQCTVYVPAGSYSYATTIVMPLNTLGSYTVRLDDGARLTYTGTSDAIQAPVVTSPNVSNWKISGGALFGTAAAASGVHVLPTNSASITDMLIFGFSSGPGLWLDGANGVTVFDNLITGNQTGILLTPTYCNGATCGIGVTGSAFTPNQIAINSNRITGNTNWNIFSSDPVTSLLTGSLDVVISGNDIELGGSAGSTFGALRVGRSHGLIVSGNYLEGSPRQIVLGIAGGGDGNQFRYYSSQGCHITNNYFTDQTNTPFDIELLDTADCQIDNNTTDNVSRNSSNCFVNTLTNNGTDIGETGTFFGKNHVENYGTGSTLCIAGAAVNNLAGAGSFSLFNLNLAMQVVGGGNYTITSSGTSETVSIPGLTTGSVCGVFPSPNVPGGAATAIASTLTTTSTPGTLTMTHPSGVLGVHVAFACNTTIN